MIELVDNIGRKRNDTKSNYASFYLSEIFSFFQLIICSGGCLGRPHCSKYLFQGLGLHHLSLIPLGLEGVLVFEALL